MPNIIKHKVTFFFVKGYEEFYKGKRSMREVHHRQSSIKKLLEGCTIPSKVKWIDVKDINRIGISDLGVIDTDLNIIFVPTDVSVLQLIVHSDFILLFISFPRSSGACKGPRTYYSYIKRVRLGLTKSYPFDIIYRRRRPWSRNHSKLGTAVKVVDLACSMDVVDPRMYTVFYKMISKEQIKNSHLHANLLKLARLKRRLFYKYVTKKQLLERLKTGFKFMGKKYPGVDGIDTI